jgi:acetyl-CoA carboxylase biotin carboxyl carrier protein
MYKVNEIRELIRMVDHSSIGEVSIKDEKNCEITIKKNETAAANLQNVQAMPQAVTPPSKEAPVIQPAEEMQEKKAVESKENKEEAPPVDQNLHEIVSPMVGTFYTAPSPEDPIYVQTGDKVEEETTVCILEAMKLFNEIEADVKGEVVEVLVENGQLVEYGQPLFHVKTE